MPTYREIYPKKSMHQGHPPQPVTVEEFYNPFTRQKIDKIVLAFYRKAARLPLNATQAEAFAGIANTDDYAKWVGHACALTTGKVPNGKPTIVVQVAPSTPAAPPAPHPDPDPDVEIDPDAVEVTAADVDALFAHEVGAKRHEIESQDDPAEAPKSTPAE